MICINCGCERDDHTARRGYAPRNNCHGCGNCRGWHPGDVLLDEVPK